MVKSPHSVQLQTFPQNDLEKFTGTVSGLWQQQAHVRPRNPINTTSVHYPQGPSLSQLRVVGTAEMRLREGKKPEAAPSQALLDQLLSTPSPFQRPSTTPPTHVHETSSVAPPLPDHESYSVTPPLPVHDLTVVTPPTPIPKASATISNLGNFKLLDPSQPASSDSLKPGAIFKRSLAMKNTGICQMGDLSSFSQVCPATEGLVSPKQFLRHDHEPGQQLEVSVFQYISAVFYS